MGPTTEARGAEDPDPLAAGPFSPWLDALDAALAGRGDSDVPCGSCTACCRSAQFVHIAPDEAATLAAIPAALRFPAPGLPVGHVVLGYDERGHCPMLGDTGCTIYQQRPRTCRTYDCRIFPAAGIDPTGDKPLIAERALRWRFDHPKERDHARHRAVGAAAAYLTAHERELSDQGGGAFTATQRAVLAVGIHRHFLAASAAGDDGNVAEPDMREIRVAIAERRRSPIGAPPR